MAERWSRRDTRSQINPRKLQPHDVVTVRTRFDALRVLHLRLVGRSSRGRLFIIGHNEHGICHRAWMDRIVHVRHRNA